MKTNSAKEQVTRIYSRRAGNYAWFHHLFTRGRDTAWRQEAAWLAAIANGARVLDVCTGVALSAIEYYRVWSYQGLTDIHITGVDYNPAMLEQGRRLVGQAGLQNAIALARADATDMGPDNRRDGLVGFADNTFDAVMNVLGAGGLDDPLAAFREMLRVCRPGGRVVIIEMHDPIAQLHGGDSFRRILWNKLIVDLVLKRLWGWINPSLQIEELAGITCSNDRGDRWRFDPVVKVVRPEPFMGSINSCIAVFAGTKVQRG